MNAARSAIMLLGAACLGLTGCVAQSKARAQAKAAYLAGQQEAMAHALWTQAAVANVTIIGPVRTPALTWSPDLTLARAIVAAGYIPSAEPRQIVIIRNGIVTQVDPSRLLAGEDIPLQQGDVVQIQ
jgi:hypothetical protein